MSDWAEKSKALKDRLSLRTVPVAFKRLERASDLDNMPGIVRWQQGCTFCQIPTLARVMGLSLAITGEDGMRDRCKRLHALLPTTEERMKNEARRLSKTWMPSEEGGMIQQEAYPLVPVGEAIVVAPLAAVSFEPDVILVYGNPAQVMMLLCGLQKIEYERFPFFFIGEGACADSIGQCYTTGKPALAIPCYGERALGQVADDEIVVALPPEDVGRAIKGLELLAGVGLKYPIMRTGGLLDPSPLLDALYSEDEG